MMLPRRMFPRYRRCSKTARRQRRQRRQLLSDCRYRRQLTARHIQLQHRQSGCTQYVVQDDPDEVTVQYTCRGDGYGRTSIRRESSSLVQIRSQGTQARTPFTIEGEARRTGPC
jgi:hypothetical protein